MTPERVGVWVTYLQDWGATDVRPHASEIDALRWVNRNGYGAAIFLPFGASVDEAQSAARTTPAASPTDRSPKK